MNKISVVIPAYNAEKTILRTLQSLRKQTCTNFEIIIVNDGSRDNTLNICEEFINNNPNMEIKVVNIPNGGLANARNVGFKYCTGDFFLNLDSDDYLEPSTFEDVIGRFKDAEVDICFYGFKEFDDNNNYFGEYDKKFIYLNDKLSGLNTFKLRIEKKIWICQGNAIYRMSLLKNNNITNIPKHDQGEDLYFISKALLHAKLVDSVEGNYFCCMKRRDSMNHESFNESFIKILSLVEQLSKDVDNLDKLTTLEKNDIKLLIEIEYINQYLNIIKRIAKAKNLIEYLKTIRELNLKSRLDRSLSVTSKLLPIRRVEYSFFNLSKTMYFLFVNLYSRIGG